jgi:hypothetical protein
MPETAKDEPAFSAHVIGAIPFEKTRIGNEAEPTDNRHSKWSNHSSASPAPFADEAVGTRISLPSHHRRNLPKE